MSSTAPSRRRYDASGRQAQARANRERILAEARRLFCGYGYAGTSVASIAAAAGVSTPTVFTAFGSKVQLLKEAVDTAIVGDAEAVPLAGRPALQFVHKGRTAPEVLRRFAAVVADVGQRAYPILAVAYAAADSDEEIAALVVDLDRQRLEGAANIARTVVSRAGVDDPERFDYVRDTIWTLISPLQYGMLVEQRGWSIERYRDWIATALVALAAKRPAAR